MRLHTDEFQPNRKFLFTHRVLVRCDYFYMNLLFILNFLYQLLVLIQLQTIASSVIGGQNPLWVRSATTSYFRLKNSRIKLFNFCRTPSQIQFMPPNNNALITPLLITVFFLCITVFQLNSSVSRSNTGHNVLYIIPSYILACCAHHSKTFNCLCSYGQSCLYHQAKSCY